MLVLLELLKFVTRLQSEKHSSSCIFAWKQQFGLSEFTDWWSCQFFGRKICECPLTQYNLRVKLTKDNCAINSPLHYESFWAYCLRQFLQKAQKCKWYQLAIEVSSVSLTMMAQNESGKGSLRWKFQQYLMTKSPAKSLSAAEIAPVAPLTHDHVLLYGRVYYMYQYILFQKLFSFLRFFLFWRNSQLILPEYFPRPQGNSRLSSDRQHGETKRIKSN